MTSKPSPVTVLFSSAGRRVELIQCFRDAAVELGLGATIFAVDLCPAMSSACRAADGAFAVPRCTTADYIPRLIEICRREKVHLLVPTIDTDLEALAGMRDAFAEIGTRICLSSLETIRMARNKAVTAQFLSSSGIPTPHTGSIDELLAQQESWRWPVILKPACGSSSVGLHVVENAGAVEMLALNRSTYIAQDLWRGKEYTVNCFFDAEGELRCAIPHYRYETRAGEVSKGITERLPVLIQIAHQLGAALRRKAFGALCFQAIVDRSGNAAVFEINARFGGGYPLAHRAGAPFAKWLLEEICGLPSSARDEWQEGFAMLRYDAAIFLRPSGAIAR